MCWPDMGSMIRCGVCAATVESILLHSSEICPSRAEHVCRLSMLEHGYLRSTDRKSLENFASNSKVGLKVLGPSVHFLEQLLNKNRYVHRTAALVSSVLRSRQWLEYG